MGRAAAPALAALLFCGCALRAGVAKTGLVVEASAATFDDGSQAGAVAAAERQALSDVLELFISSATRAASSRVLEEKILAAPRVYISKYRLLARTPARGPGREPVRARILALIAIDRLLKDLDSLGLVRPKGVYGSPSLLVSLKETGTGAGRDVGRASDALRRQLEERGYEVRDMSDRLDARGGKSGSDALAAAKIAGANVALIGAAAAEPVPDERLQGYHAFRAVVTASASWVATGEVLAPVEAEATAVDLFSAAAAAKALENAGDLAADKLALALDGRFRERSALSLTVVGIDQLARLRRLAADLRGLKGVAGAAVAGMAPGEARLQIFVEKLSAEDLAVLLLRLPGYAFEIRSVDPDYHSIEVEISPAAGADGQE